ncbi:GapR family DNA-binding domain-containing protein [Ochrobactrum sp. A-1]|uniref:GapR family DNA-binding domain-containing protein n=1 Tax=Ochrobactrum sp. A-1 TaxID=2920940 RepID=UPI001F0B63EA|nr:DUF2312 domain-containing protein [Ochrobactrum sp. A-1]
MSEKPDLEGGDNAQVIAVGQLRAFLERRERLEEEKATIGEDIKELNAEIKASGFDMKAFNEMVKLRKMDPTERKIREAQRQLYGELLGVFG